MPDTQAPTAVQATLAEAQDWLFRQALPLWFSAGRHPAHGGYVDLLDDAGQPLRGPRRSFVQARMAYTAVEAGRLGWDGPWREHAEAGLALLRGVCRHPQGGVVHRLTDDAQVDRADRDLYDQAFTAFALAECSGPLNRPELLDEARAMLEWLERDWARPPSGLWEGELLPQPPRRQNPYMHLLEATVAIARASGGAAPDIARANRWAAFARDTLFDLEAGALPEYFAMDWSPAPGEEGLITEPGHQFEWAWLLCRLKDVGGDDHTALAQRIWRHGLRHGICATRGVAVDSVLLDGTPHSAKARLWPQTERLKAAVAMHELGLAEGTAEIPAAFAGLKLYFAKPPLGSLYDRLLPDGSFVAEPARSSSMYHIICAIAELRRVA